MMVYCAREREKEEYIVQNDISCAARSVHSCDRGFVVVLHDWLCNKGLP